MIQSTFPVGPLACNCTILGCERTKEAIVIDPGDEAEKIMAHLTRLNLRVTMLLHTHAHFDHVGGSKKIKTQVPSVTLSLHPDDQWMYDHLTLQGQLFGFLQEAPLPIDHFLKHGEEIRFGDCRLNVIHTPGHSPGSVCFHLLEGKEKATLFSGDTLFYRDIGRTDLWGGDEKKIISSIRNELFTLPEETPVIPGHGRFTSIGQEKQSNPYIA